MKGGLTEDGEAQCSLEVLRVLIGESGNDGEDPEAVDAQYCQSLRSELLTDDVAHLGDYLSKEGLR